MKAAILAFIATPPATALAVWGLKAYWAHKKVEQMRERRRAARSQEQGR